jgi:hypothetical protein
MIERAETCVLDRQRHRNYQPAPGAVVLTGLAGLLRGKLYAPQQFLRLAGLEEVGWGRLAWT